MNLQDNPSNPIPASSPNHTSRIIKNTFGYLFAIACLIWVFHDIQFHELLSSMANIHWSGVAIAIIFDILSYVCQGIRWRFLLKGIGDISTLKTTQAIYAGLFTNELLPLRIGELVRAYLVSRWLSADFVSVIPSMAVERLFDGVWLALAIGIAAVFVPLPKDILEGEELLGVIVLLSTVLFIYLIFREKKTHIDENYEGPPGWKPFHLFRSLIGRLHVELQRIGSSRFMYISFFVSVFVLFFQIVSFWLVMIAYDLNLSFWAGAVVFLIVHLGTAIPNAPANVGTYQFFCVVGLSLYGVDKTPAAAFSIVVFVILTVPLWVIGFFALNSTGMSLRAIRGEINKLLKRENG